MSKLITLRPRLSEKAYATSQALNKYVFFVPQDANKQTVAQAISDQFGVTVLSVNIANSKGKAKRSVRKNGRAIMGTRSNKKYAYVTVKSGETIPIFAAEQAEEAKEAKVAAKAAKKEKK